LSYADTELVVMNTLLLPDRRSTRRHGPRMCREWINVSAARWFQRPENIPVGRHGKSGATSPRIAASTGRLGHHDQTEDHHDDPNQNRAKKDAAIVSAGGYDE